MKTILFSILLIAVGVQHALADVAGVRPETVTSKQLENTVIESGVLVINLDDPSDLRWGDGVTVGGHRVGSAGTVTQTFNGPIYLGGHALNFGDVYAAQESTTNWALTFLGSPVFSAEGRALASAVIGYSLSTGTLSITSSWYPTTPSTNAILARWTESLLEPRWFTLASTTATNGTNFITSVAMPTGSVGYVAVSAVDSSSIIIRIPRAVFGELSIGTQSLNQAFFDAVGSVATLQASLSLLQSNFTTATQAIASLNARLLASSNGWIAADTLITQRLHIVETSYLAFTNWFATVYTNINAKQLDGYGVNAFVKFTDYQEDSAAFIRLVTGISSNQAPGVAGWFSLISDGGTNYPTFYDASLSLWGRGGSLTYGWTNAP